MHLLDINCHGLKGDVELACFAIKALSIFSNAPFSINTHFIKHWGSIYQKIRSQLEHAQSLMRIKKNQNVIFDILHNMIP